MTLQLDCYKGNKRVYKVEVCMNGDDLTNQIKNGILTYGNPDNGIEILNLRNFNKVIITNMPFYDWERFYDRGSDKE